MGVSPEKAARSAAARPLREVLDVKEDDAEFSDAWDAIILPEGGRGRAIGRRLNGQTLEALLWAQCTDEQTAAYFNMETGEMLAAIEQDEELKRIHKLARQAGQAQIKMTQMNEATAGNGQMAMWIGKQYMGQSDKVEQQVKHDVKALDNYELARRIAFLLEENKLKPNAFITIEGTAREISEEPVDKD